MSACLAQSLDEQEGKCIHLWSKQGFLILHADLSLEVAKSEISKGGRWVGGLGRDKQGLMRV